MKKTLLLACLFGILIPGVVLSSDGNTGWHHPNPAVKKYVKERVMPVLQQKRQILEAELTPEEKSTIAECRATLKQLHEQGRQMHEQQRNQQLDEEVNAELDRRINYFISVLGSKEKLEEYYGKSIAELKADFKDDVEKQLIADKMKDKALNEPGVKDNAEGNAPQHAPNGNFAQDHQQMKEIMQKLEVIATNHSNTLDNIKTDLEPARKQWKDDIQRLLPQNQNGEAHYEHGYRAFEPFLMGYHHAAARFLLLPATGPVDEQEAASPDELRSDEVTGPAPAPSTTASLSSFQVFPNPASNEIITGTNALPGENQLTIMDMQGNVVMNLQNVQASQHVDVSQLPAGNYLVQIKDASQTVSQKIVISR